MKLLEFITDMIIFPEGYLSLGSWTVIMRLFYFTPELNIATQFFVEKYNFTFTFYFYFIKFKQDKIKSH